MCDSFSKKGRTWALILFLIPITQTNVNPRPRTQPHGFGTNEIMAIGGAMVGATSTAGFLGISLGIMLNKKEISNLKKKLNDDHGDESAEKIREKILELETTAVQLKSLNFWLKIAALCGFGVMAWGLKKINDESIKIEVKREEIIRRITRAKKTKSQLSTASEALRVASEQNNQMEDIARESLDIAREALGAAEELLRERDEVLRP